MILKYIIRISFVLLFAVHGYAQDNFELHVLTLGGRQQIAGNFEEVKNNNLSLETISCLYETKDQLIWIGTEQYGLFAYDGTGFKQYRFDRDNIQSLPSDDIIDIWEETPYILWVTTSKGLAKFDRLTQKISRFSADSKFIAKGNNNKLYTAATDLHIIDTATKKLIRVPGQEVFLENGLRYRDEFLGNIDHLSFDNKNNLWAIGKSKTLSGLFQFDFATHHWIFHAPPVHYDTPGKKSANPNYLFTERLFVGKNGRIWVYGWDIGILCYDPVTVKWKQFYIKNDQNVLLQNVIKKITQLNDSSLLVSGQQFVLVLNTNNYTANTYSYTKNEDGSLPDISFPITLKDHNENIWFASDGIYKLSKFNNRFINTACLPVQPATISAYLSLAPGYFLITTTNYTYKPQPLTCLSVIDGNQLKKTFILPFHDWIREIVPAGNNNFYLAATQLYTFNLQSGQVNHIPLTNADPQISTAVPYDFYNNILWNDSILYSCRRTTEEAGLRKINLETHTTRYFKTASKTLSPYYPQGNSIERIMKDSYGRIWCSSEAGIDLFYPAKEIFEHYHYIEGDSTSLPNNKFPRFIETADHHFFTATQSGLCEVNNAAKGKLSFNIVMPGYANYIVEDKQHMLWLGTDASIIRFDPKTKNYKEFTKADGYSWDSRFKMFVMDDGNFLMRDGSIVNPYTLPENTRRPIPRITDFMIAGQPALFDSSIEFKKNIRLQHDQNFFSISFSCDNLIHERNNRYRYFLEEVDKDWVDAGSRSIAYYTSVPPGNYTFYVQAANNDGVWGDAVQMLTISIIPAWYQTWLFIILLTLAVFSIIYIIYRQQVNIVKAKSFAKEKEAELKLVKAEFEKQMAETEMAALRAQMNPHFIFNVLNSINRFILMNDSEAASGYLSQFSKLIRLILEHSKTARITLEKDIEALRIYIDMEKLRFQNKFSYTVDIDNAIEESYIKIPPLLLQPYAENAIWHGLMQKDAPGHLLIKILLVKEDLIKVVIEDNGIGREKSAELKSKSAVTHKSFGLQISSDRIKIVNKLYGLNTEVQVEDLYLNNNEPAGTRINLFIAV